MADFIFPENVNTYEDEVAQWISEGNDLDAWRGAPSSPLSSDSSSATNEGSTSDFFWYNGRWYTYTTDVSPDLETLAQSLWDGRIDLESEVSEVPAGPLVTEDDQEDGSKISSQSIEQNTYVREDTPIPDWGQSDHTKSMPQASEATTTSREATPVPEQSASQPPSIEKDNAKPSASKPEERDHFPVWDGPTRCPYRCRALLDTEELYVSHMRTHKGRSYTCEAPGCSKVYVHMRTLRKHQRQAHGNPQSGGCVVWSES
ncbi:hypothetical protein COCCADRAFT_24941 [Bipolaris zeicola 26-R-13]|uniref:C2H2-type domain-containing protein n=1 Tax=Cochliobolus carbonum (strain 26-R-13) TaxID=930089 RepID=W6YBT1_COCC2|nr:uncharacterized protein COCCADRAFT_24941 [Bipolaris zeicola 26-R-13]EUC35055.1 hypothetical protein COCCADRAFT_24941 [Bipolaris zeicola 26-R-13]